MSWSHLTPEQAEHAEQIFRALKQDSDSELRDLAALLASKPDHQLLGQAEFEVRERVHKLGAGAIEAAVNLRKKATVF